MNRWTLTIGREFCSGGAEIGRQVAEMLGIPFYDKKIIDATADLLKISSQVVEHHDERPARVWEMAGVSGVGFQYGGSLYAADPALTLPLSYKIADAQFSVMRQFVSEGPCVLIGRCADYILRERQCVFNIFLRAELHSRVQRAMDLYRLNEVDALRLVKKTDRIRATYYNGHTRQRWGASESYHMVIDTGLLGIGGTAELITHMMQKLNKE